MSDYLVKTTAEWDSQYRNGHWDYLKFKGERPHYSAVAECIHQHHHNGSIVDLGCGFGELWKYLYEDEKKKYTGIDYSAEAIKMAKQLQENCFYLCDINDYIPSEKLEIIVINEVLYYIPRPLEMLNKVFHWLTRNGVVILSLYIGPNKQTDYNTITNNIITGIKNRNDFIIYDESLVTSDTQPELQWNIYVIGIDRD